MPKSLEFVLSVSSLSDMLPVVGSSGVRFGRFWADAARRFSPSKHAVNATATAISPTMNKKRKVKYAGI